MTLTTALTDHPDRRTFDLAELEAAIGACLDCTAACTTCADTDLARDPAAMRDCIRRCLDCADVCAVTARVLARPSPSGDAWEQVVLACIAQCDECADECGRHDHVCCQTCAEACRACAAACRALLAVAD